MIRSFGLLAALAAFSGATAQDIQGPKLKVIAFHVVTPEGAEGVLALGDLGTRVTTRLEKPGWHLLWLDLKASKVESFTDDKNTDLLAAPVGRRVIAPLSAERSGGRGKLNDLTFQAPGCPARGATKVRIKGSVVALLGKDEKEVEKKDFAGTADLAFGTLKERKAGFVGESNFYVLYEGEKPLKSVSLVGADGKTITCSLDTRFAPPDVKKSVYWAMIRADGGVAPRGTLRVKYFEAVEEITIPVDLEVGPGF